MKCPKCGSEDLSIDVTVVIPFKPNGNHIGETNYTFQDIYEQVASNSSDDIQVYCYDCGCSYPVKWAEDGSIVPYAPSH